MQIYLKNVHNLMNLCSVIINQTIANKFVCKQMFKLHVCQSYPASLIYSKMWQNPIAKKKAKIRIFLINLKIINLNTMKKLKIPSKIYKQSLNLKKELRKLVSFTTECNF